MKSWMKAALTAVLTGALVVGFVGVGMESPSQACDSAKVAKRTQNERLSWRTDFDKALVDAKKDAKPVVAFFGTDACGSCDKMVDGTLADKKVQKALEGFVKVHVDMTDGSDKARKKIADKFEVDSLPAVVFFDEKGEVVRSVKLDKLISADEFLGMVKKVASRS